MKLSDICDGLSDRLNPVLIKELRQHFHNKFLIGLMTLLMLGELLILFIIQNQYGEMNSSTRERLGMISYVIQMVAVGVCVAFICGLLAASRFNNERKDRDLDYSRTSTLTPFSIVLGKFISSFLVMIFIYSVCLPFMVIAYFLNGVSIHTMFLWVFALTPIYMLVMQLCLLTGTIGKKGAEGLVIVAFWQFLPGAIYAVNYFTSASRDVMSYFNGEICIFIVFVVVFTLTIAAVSSRRSNVAFWPRVLCSSMFLFYPAMFFLLLYIRSLYEAGWSFKLANFFVNAVASIEAWWKTSVYIYTGLILLLLLIVCFERREPGIRVLAERPKNRILRFIFMFFSSGQTGGLLLVYVLTGLAFSVIFCTGNSANTETIPVLFISLYVLFYTQISMLLERWVFKNNKIVAFVITLLTLFIGPLLIYSIASSVPGSSNNWHLLLCLTPACLFNGDYMLYRMVPVCLAGVSFLFNLPFLSKQARYFMMYKLEDVNK